MTPLPPSDLDAEESAVGCLLAAGKGAADIAARMASEGLRAEMFYRPSLGLVYSVALEMLARSEPLDSVTVRAELDRTGRLAQAGGSAVIHTLARTVPAVSNHQAYARRIVELAGQRTVQREADQLARSAQNGSFNKAAALEQLDRIRDALTEAGSQVTLTATTAQALCALPDAGQVDELIGPLLVCGQRLVIGAGTGEGKTTLSLALARAVATGGEFLGYQAKQGRVLIVDAEQGARTLKRRLSEAGLENAENVDIVRVPDGLALDRDAAHIAALDALLRAGNYAVVILDPLYKLHTGDSNAEREAVDLMRQLDRWRAEYNFALVLPVHLRKPPPGAKFSLNEFFGSTAYTRGAEVAIGLQRVRAGYTRLFFLKDRDGDLPIGETWGLLFDREQGYRRDPDDTSGKKSATEHVRELLDADPGITPAKLRDATGYAERTIRKALKDLHAEAEDRAGPNGERGFRLPIEEDI